MLNPDLDRLKRYEDACLAQQTYINTLKKQIDQRSITRLVLLLVEIGFFVGLTSSTGSPANAVWSVLLLLPVAAFVMVVKKQNVLEKQLKFHQNLLWVYSNEVNLIQGKPNGYDVGTKFEDELHPYLSDLDIFGKSSLYALINRGATKIGMEELAKHLAEPTTVDVAIERQQAIVELTSKIENTFVFRANLRGNDLNRIEEMKAKLEGQLLSQVKFTEHRLLRFYVNSIPYLMAVLLVLGLIFGGSFWSVFGIAAFVNAMLTYFYSKKITAVYVGFSGGSNLLSNYADAIAWTEQYNWQNDYIRRLFHSSDKVSDQINALSKIIVAFDARLNFLLYAILNFFLLWDLRCSIQLGDWCKTASNKVAKGLDRIGYFEELISFATLNYNHPEWHFPTFSTHFHFDAEELGHPLISKGKCVNNNFSLKEHPTVDIVTGSNMAGKSTFLRTVGINMVLAYAGAPVCAKKMKLSSFRLLTYMRIKDNLIESTSTFKAELNRLKMILTAVEKQPNAFVLIDEMLRGTNSKDKFDGSKAFIEKLINLKTPTLFATHDLQLSELEQVHPQSVRNFHFDIQLVANEMEFDYLIKQGPCTKFNAAILLKQIGLGG
jgi:hypothetical protein